MKHLFPLFLLVSLHLLYSCRSEETPTNTPGSGDSVAVDTSLVDTVTADTLVVDTVTVDTVTVDTASVDTVVADTVPADTVDRVSREEQIMTPALLYLLSHSSEEDILAVIVRIHVSPTFNRITQEGNRLKGIIHPYTKADIEAFMAEEKQKFEIVEQEYQEMWSQVGARHGLSFDALKASDLNYPSNQFQLSPAMIHALAQDSLVVLMDVQGEEPQPL